MVKKSSISKNSTFVKGRGWVSNKKKSTSSTSTKIKNSFLFGTAPKSILEGAKIERGSGKSVRAGSSGNIKTTMTDTRKDRTTTTTTTNKGQLLKKQVKQTSTGKVLSSYKGNTALQKSFNQAGLGFLSNTYNQNQLRRIQKNLRDQQIIALRRIDNRKDLNVIQKEIKKRDVLSLNDGDFIKEVKSRKQIKDKPNKEKIKAFAEELNLSKPAEVRLASGQSMTPKQQTELSIKFNKQTIKTKRHQLKIFKSIPSSVAKGVYEVGKEIILIPYSIYKVSKSYGSSLGRRTKNNNYRLDKVIANDIAKVSVGLVEGIGWISSHPKETAVVLGVGVGAIGSSIVKDFEKDPVKALTKIVLYLNPNLIVKGVKTVGTIGIKGVKTSAKTVKQLETLVKNIKIPVKTRKLETYSFMIKEPKFKDLVKNFSKEQFLKLKMNKISSIVQKAKKIETQFKAGTTIKRSKDILISNVKKITSIPKNVLNKINEERLKLILSRLKNKKIKPIQFKVGTSKERILSKLENVYGISKQYLKDLKLKKINNIVKEINKNSPKTTTFKISETVKRKKVLGGKKARVGIPKQIMQEVNQITDKAQDTIKKGLQLNKDDVLKFTIGEVKDKQKVSFKIGKQLQQNKKIQDRVKTVLKKIQKINKSSALTIQEIKLIKNLNKLKLINSSLILLRNVRLRRLRVTQTDISKLNSKIRINLRDVLKDVEQAKATDLKRIQERAVKKLQDTLKDTLKDISTKKIKKIVPKSKLILKKPPTKPPKPPKVPRLRLSINNLPKNQVAIFEGTFRERRNPKLKASKKNPIIVKTIKLTTTKNRLLNKLATRVDNSAARSMEIKLKGITNKKLKEVSRTNNLKKFTVKKKGSKVLKLVEKTEFIRDTKGEKREIKKKRK